jgi:hypothetical protein
MYLYYYCYYCESCTPVPAEPPPMLKVGRRVLVSCCVPRRRLVGCVALLVTARSAVGNGGGGGAGGGGGGGISGIAGILGCEKHIAILSLW